MSNGQSTIGHQANRVTRDLSGGQLGVKLAYHGLQGQRFFDVGLRQAVLGSALFREEILIDVAGGGSHMKTVLGDNLITYEMHY